MPWITIQAQLDAPTMALLNGLVTSEATTKKTLSAIQASLAAIQAAQTAAAKAASANQETLMADIDDFKAEFATFSADFSTFATDNAAAIATLQAAVNSGNSQDIKDATAKLVTLDTQVQAMDAAAKAIVNPPPPGP